MNRNLKNILIIYILIVIVLIGSYIYSSSYLYDNVKVLKTSKENKMSLKIRIPKEIQISNPYLGNATIIDKYIMNNLLYYFNKILLSEDTCNNILPLENTLPLSGTINYLNGHKDSFSISNNLKINNTIYSSNSYWINILRNKLKEYFYTLENLENIISSQKSSVIYIKDKEFHYLNDTEKINLTYAIKKLKIMDNNKNFLETDLNELPNYHLTIYIDSSKSINSNNTFYFDVYKNYCIIQYLGDENGKNIYIKGDIDEKTFKY